LQSGVTEANVALSRKPLNRLDVLRTYPALLDKYRPNRPALVARRRFRNWRRLANYFFHYSVLLAN
jgi:hypothetical protein